MSQNIIELNRIIEEFISFVNEESLLFNSKILASKENTIERTNQKSFDDICEEGHIDLKEELNKSQYEAMLAKKHLAKLKQYCNNIEKKNTPIQTKRTDKNDKGSQKGDKAQKANLTHRIV